MKPNDKGKVPSVAQFMDASFAGVMRRLDLVHGGAQMRWGPGVQRRFAEFQDAVHRYLDLEEQHVHGLIDRLMTVARCRARAAGGSTAQVHRLMSVAARATTGEHFEELVGPLADLRDALVQHHQNERQTCYALADELLAMPDRRAEFISTLEQPVP